MAFPRVRLVGLCRRPIRIPLSAVPSRLASSDSHTHYEDNNVYPQETFNTPFWRNTLLLTLFGYGLYYVVPLIDEDGNHITRLIQEFATPSSVWTRINDKHLELAMKAAQGHLLVSAAQRPLMHRIRNPASFDKGSPHRVAVGTDVDLSDLVVKKDKLWTE